MDTRPLSERLRISFPCPMKWSEMEGDDRVRHCGACKMNVYNSAAMTTAEIEQLLCSSDRVCMNIYRRADGTLVTGDCSRLWAERRDAAGSLLKEGLSVFGLLVVVLLVVGLALVTFFGDNIRRLYGASAGGVPSGPATPTISAKKQLPMRSFSSSSSY